MTDVTDPDTRAGADARRRTPVDRRVVGQRTASLIARLLVAAVLGRVVAGWVAAVLGIGGAGPGPSW